jgi:hypothetical protein
MCIQRLAMRKRLVEQKTIDIRRRPSSAGWRIHGDNVWEEIAEAVKSVDQPLPMPLSAGALSTGQFQCDTVHTSVREEGQGPSLKCGRLLLHVPAKRVISKPHRKVLAIAGESEFPRQPAISVADALAQPLCPITHPKSRDSPPTNGPLGDQQRRGPAAPIPSPLEPPTEHSHAGFMYLASALVQISRHEQTLLSTPCRLQAPSTALQTAGAARP